MVGGGFCFTGHKTSSLVAIWQDRRSRRHFPEHLHNFLFQIPDPALEDLQRTRRLVEVEVAIWEWNSVDMESGAYGNGVLVSNHQRQDGKGKVFESTCGNSIFPDEKGSGRSWAYAVSNPFDIPPSRRKFPDETPTFHLNLRSGRRRDAAPHIRTTPHQTICHVHHTHIFRPRRGCHWQRRATHQR